MSTDDVVRTGVPRFPIITLRPTLGQTLRLLSVADVGHIGVCAGLYGAWGYYLARYNPFRRVSTVAGAGLGVMFGLAWSAPALALAPPARPHSFRLHHTSHRHPLGSLRPLSSLWRPPWIASTHIALRLSDLFARLSQCSCFPLEIQRNWHLLSGNLNNQHVVGDYEFRLDRPDLRVLPDGVFFERDANARINELAESKAYMPHKAQHVAQ